MNDDLISRQAAIDVLGVFTQADALGHTPKQIVEALPSAQQETCDTCKYGYFGDGMCDYCRVRYQSHYERRTDGVQNE